MAILYVAAKHPYTDVCGALDRHSSLFLGAAQWAEIYGNTLKKLPNTF